MVRRRPALRASRPLIPTSRSAWISTHDAQTKKLDERNKIAQDIWKTYVDAVLAIGTVGLSPAFLGMRVTSNKLGNIPARHVNAQHMRTPTSSRPTTIFFKS